MSPVAVLVASLPAHSRVTCHTRANARRTGDLPSGEGSPRTTGG